ncbi:MAG: hypothetical protein AAGL90_03065 [Pseudomonadota bacterium]
MPTAIFVPIFLRLAGPLSFVVSTLIAGVMNRSVILVIALAAAATATTILIRWWIPSPVTDLKAAISPESLSNPPHPLSGMGRRFVIGVVGYAFLFGLAALLAALFQTTEFERQLTTDDLWFLGVPAGLALIGAYFSARLGYTQIEGVMAQMQVVAGQFRAQQGPASTHEDDAFTVEGEVIDPPDDRS